jgi:hypothetical protein
VQRAWARDPLVLVETKGTAEIHGKREALNQMETKEEKMVRKVGFEPTRLAAPPPQDGASASSATSAKRER